MSFTTTSGVYCHNPNWLMARCHHCGRIIKEHTYGCYCSGITLDEEIKELNYIKDLEEHNEFVE